MYITILKTILTAVLVNIALTQAVFAVDGKRTLMVEVSYSGDVYAVKRAWLINKSIPGHKAPGSRANDITINLTDNNAALLHTTKIRNPRILRSPLNMPDEQKENTGHKIIQMDSGSFILRLPYAANTRYLYLMEANRDITTLQQAKDNNRRLDLADHLIQ